MRHLFCCVCSRWRRRRGVRAGADRVEEEHRIVGEVEEVELLGEAFGLDIELLQRGTEWQRQRRR